MNTDIEKHIVSEFKKALRLYHGGKNGSLYMYRSSEYYRGKGENYYIYWFERSFEDASVIRWDYVSGKDDEVILDSGKIENTPDLKKNIHDSLIEYNKIIIDDIINDFYSQFKIIKKFIKLDDLFDNVIDMLSTEKKTFIESDNIADIKIYMKALSDIVRQHTYRLDDYIKYYRRQNFQELSPYIDKMNNLYNKLKFTSQIIDMEARKLNISGEKLNTYLVNRENKIIL